MPLSRGCFNGALVPTESTHQVCHLWSCFGGALVCVITSWPPGVSGLEPLGRGWYKPRSATICAWLGRSYKVICS